MILATRAARRGFTFLEMITVAAIILILMAMTTGAYLRYSDVQRKRVTLLTLEKVDTMVKQHWNAVVTRAKDDAIPTGFVGNRNDYIKACLKREFPTSFSEALNPTAPLQPCPTYQLKLQGVPAPAADVQNAICLTLALEQDRGVASNLDKVLSMREFPIDPTTGLRYLTDDWKKPLVFFREPTGNAEINRPGLDPNLILEWSIVAPGRNGRLGLDGTMAVTSQDADDNYYSHRLRAGKTE